MAKTLVCPNKRLKAWKDLVAIQGEDVSYALWDKFDGVVPNTFYEQSITQSIRQAAKTVSVDTEGYKSIQVPDSNSRYFETQLGLRDSTGKPKTFDTQAEATIFYKKALDNLSRVNPSLYNILRGRYNMRFGKVLVKARVGKPATTKYKMEFIANYSKAFDEEYGEFSIDEAKAVANDLFGKREGLTSGEVITKLLESKHLDAETKQTLQLLADIDVPVVFQALEGVDLMMTNGEVIVVNVSMLDNTHPKLLSEAFVHELVHIKTVNALENPQQPAEIFLQERVNYLYNLLKKYDTENKYGFKDASEFVAELLSNSDFKQYVKSLENNNIWNKFINFIAEFIGIPRGSAKLINQLNDFISKDKQPSTFKVKSKKVSTASQQVLDKMIASVSTRIKALEHRIGENSDTAVGITEQNRLLNTLLQAYRNGTNVKGILEYFTQVKLLTNNFEDIVSDQRKAVMVNDYERILRQAGTIRSLGNFAYSQSNLVDALIENLRGIKKEFADNPEMLKVVDEAVQVATEVQTRMKLLKADYMDLSKIVFAKFLVPFGMGKSLDHIQEVLSTPSIDISAKSRWLHNLQESGDEALAMIDVALKNYYNDANRELLDFEKDMLKMKEELEKKGIKKMDFMVKKKNGKSTHYFLTERDIVGYKEAREKFAASLPEATDENIKRENRKKWIQFFSENGISRLHNTDAYFELIAAKEKELGPKKFKVWFELNTIYNPKTGDHVIPKAIDGSYTRMMSDSLKQDAYFAVLGKKQQLEKKFPKSKRRLRRLPQVRKDFIERVKDGNWNRMFEEVKEGLQIKEDETEYGYDYGLKDEAGNIIRFVPIYFVNKIKNPEDLSNDIASSMIAFAHSSIKHDKLSLITDVLELGKEVIKERGVFETSNRGKILKTVRKYAGVRIEETQTKDTPGRVYERLDQYMKMFLYGETKKRGKDIKHTSINSEKFIDALGRYTAVRTLAINTYAGIANAATGESLITLEAIQGKFFDKSNLSKAQALYHQFLPGTLADIGKRRGTHKLTLWTEYMDSMNNFEERIYNVDAERKTKLGQMANGSAVFLTSKLPEHKLHNTVSLAVADSFRYDKNSNKFVFKEQFYKSLTDLKNKQANKLKALRKEEVEKANELKKEGKQSELKELHLEYKRKAQEIIALESRDKAAEKELQDKLDSQWKEMTNYWDAHEPKDGKLVLKPEFEGVDSRTDRNNFINRQHSVNDSIQGMYSLLNKNALQYTAWGRLAMMYRKWIIPSFNRRFLKEHTNFEKQMDVEGYYITLGNYMFETLRDLKNGSFSMFKNWKSLTTEEKSNVRRTLLDVTTVMALSLLGKALLEMTDDDDDNWAFNMLAYQINRLKTELGALTPPFAAQEGFKLVNSPLAAVNTVQELYYMFSSGGWFDEVERGKYEGLLGIEKNLIRITPMANTIYSLRSPEEQVKYFTTKSW